LQGREAVRKLGELFTQIRTRRLLASEYHQHRQEVESCYGPTERPTYVPRIRVTVAIHESATSVPESQSVLGALQRVLDLARIGAVRNLRVDLDPCGDGLCRGMRLVLWYDDESDAIPAMCA
jgi:hypothetical protein